MLNTELIDVADDLLVILLVEGACLVSDLEIRGTGLHTALLSAAIAYSGGFRLDVRLTLSGAGGYPLWQRYSFHFMGQDDTTIFRYDNAPHYPGLEHSPHHKHVGPEETVFACPQPSVRMIRDEIEVYLVEGN